MQYGPKIVTNNLVLHLDVGDKKSYSGSGSTAWNDLSPNRNHFTLYNSPTFNSIYGGELRFDGTNDYARNRNNTVINSIAANGSVEFWCRTYNGTFAGSGFSRLLSVSNDAGTGSDTTSTQGTNNDYSNFIALARPAFTAPYEFMALYYVDPPGKLYGNNVAINDNLYRQVIYTWSTSGATKTFSHYLNGVFQVSNNANKSSFSGAQHITIGMNSCGAYLSASEVFKGAVSIARFYSKTLSQSEITQNFNANRGRFSI